MSRIVHFEIPVDDIERAKKFYENVFGWRLDLQKGPWGEHMSLITGSDESPGINGAFYLKKNVPPENAKFINIVDVDDIGEYLTRLKNRGAEILFGKVPVKGVGYLAYFRDPDGNVLGMMQRDEKAGME